MGLRSRNIRIPMSTWKPLNHCHSNIQHGIKNYLITGDGLRPLLGHQRDSIHWYIWFSRSLICDPIRDCLIMAQHYYGLVWEIWANVSKKIYYERTNRRFLLKCWGGFCCPSPVVAPLLCLQLYFQKDCPWCTHWTSND